MSNTVVANSSAIYLVPAGTISEGSGHGSPLELGALAAKPLLLILEIAEVLEQESLHVSIWGSADGPNWGAQAVFWFPQKFHCRRHTRGVGFGATAGHKISSSSLGSEPVGPRYSAHALQVCRRSAGIRPLRG